MSYPLSSVDISNQGLTELPKEIINQRNNIEFLDISNNNFQDLKKIAQILSQFPKLTNLNIDIENEDDAILILKTLKNLQILNGVSTNEEEEENNENNNNNNNNNNNINDNNNNEIDEEDLNIPEVKEASLQSEISNFNEIITNIKKYYNKNQEEINKFCEEFQNFLKSKIDIINNMINSNTSNLLYSINVYHSKIEIYSFLNKKINSILKEITNINKFNNCGILLFSLEKIEEYRNENENIINKIINETKNEKINLNLKKENKKLNSEINNLTNELNIYKKEKKENEAIIRNVKNENRNLQEMNKILKKDNERITGNLFKKADKLLKNNNNEKKNFEIKNEEEEKNNFSLKTLFENNNEKINLGETRILAKNFLLELINEIYKTKINSDNKNIQNHYPKYTLEQHLFNYLKSKYGLKKLIIEWAINIFNGIKLYSKTNGEIFLFGLLLRNEIDEGSIQILNKIKESVKIILKDFIQNENKFDKILNGNIYLDENLWKNITYILFNDNIKLGEKFIKKIEDFIENKINNIEILNQIGKKILYKDYLNLLITYNVNLRRKYLSNLVEIFRLVDQGKNGLITKEGFKEIILRINIFNPNEIEDKTNYLIGLIDNYGFNQINFSDLVFLFDNEFIIDNQTGEKIKILDKIASKI